MFSLHVLSGESCSVLRGTWINVQGESNLIVEFYQTFKEKLYQYANMHHIIL